MRVLRVLTVLAMVLALGSSAFAQSRGNLRVTGRVVDEAGQPVADAQVRAAKRGEAQPQIFNAKTNDKGEYTLNGLAAGDWVIEAAKEGVGVREVSATLTEGERTTTVDITIAKPAPAEDPNAVLQKEHTRALELAKSGKIPEARAIYEELIAKYPNVYQLQAMLGNMYAAEGNAAKALEHLNLALEKEPANVDWLLLKSELLMEVGQKDEAEKLLEGIDITQAKDPRAFINLAINYINGGKHAEAIDLLTKLAAQFPDDPTILYYRARAYLAAQKLPEAQADLEKFVAAAPPGTPQLPDAQKLLEQLKKK